MDAYFSFPALFHEIKIIHIYTSFFLIDGEGLDAKKIYFLASLYIGKLKKKCNLFLGLLHTEENKREEEKFAPLKGPQKNEYSK